MADTSPPDDNPSPLTMSLEDWIDLGENSKVLGNSDSYDFLSNVFLAGVSESPSDRSPPIQRLSSSSSSSSSSLLKPPTRLSTSFTSALSIPPDREDSEPFFPLQLPTSDKLDHNLSHLKSEIEEYEAGLISLNESVDSDQLSGLYRHKVWEKHFGKTICSLPSIDSAFSTVRKRINERQKSSPNLQYRSVSNPSLSGSLAPFNAPSLVGSLEGLFTEEQRDGLLFYFVPGIYSGHVPGSADSPDIFKVWFQQIQATFNLDCRYPTNYPVDGTCLENADFLRNEAERLHETHEKKIVFVGYSKGSADVFTFVSLHQESKVVQEYIYGVISVCGAFGGSPLASVMTTNYLYIRGIVQLIIEKTMGCDFQALLDVTLSERDTFLDSHTLPDPFPFPVLSAVGIISGCPYDGFYPLYKFIKKIHGIRSDGVVSEADQCIPGSMRVTIPGMNHTVSISDPVPFWGALFWSLLNCRGETHDERSGWVSVEVHSAKYCYESAQEEVDKGEKYFYLFGSRIEANVHEREREKEWDDNDFLFSSDASFSPCQPDSPCPAGSGSLGKSSSPPPPSPVFGASLQKEGVQGDFFVKITKTNSSSDPKTTSPSHPTTSSPAPVNRRSSPLPRSPLSAPCSPTTSPSPSPSPSTPPPPSRIEKCAVATWEDGDPYKTLSFPSTISSLSNTDELLIELLVDDGDPSSPPKVLMEESVKVGEVVSWEEREKDLELGTKGVSVSVRLKLFEGVLS